MTGLRRSGLAAWPAQAQALARAWAQAWAWAVCPMLTMVLALLGTVASVGNAQGHEMSLTCRPTRACAAADRPAARRANTGVRSMRPAH